MKRASRRQWFRPAVVALVAMMATLGVAACGGGGGGGSSYKEPKGAAQTTLTVRGGNFFFDPKDPTVPAGIVAIKFESTEGLHTFEFAGKLPGFKLEASSGKSQTLKANLKPGKYTFFCDIPGHREAGMEGTLTVT